MELLWWHWVAVGILLALLELAVPAFFLVWFGLGAIFVGLALTLLPLPFSFQLVLWAAASCAMVFFWFKYLKGADHRIGTSKEAFLGEVGMIVREVTPLAKGEIRFQKPILGSETWPVIADESIAAGERARIVDVIGQTLKVSRRRPEQT